jgi:hypothetical protein
MTSSKLLIIYHDSKKSLLTLYPDNIESPLISISDSPLITYQDNNTLHINESKFLITFPNSHESSTINECLIEQDSHESSITNKCLIEQDSHDTNVIMCATCNNSPSLFKIYKKFAPFTYSWLKYYNTNDDIDCKHKVWRDIRYECENCAVKYKNSDKFIKIILVNTLLDKYNRKLRQFINNKK